MQLITQVGDYPVIIGEPHWEEQTTGANASMILVLPVHTDDGELGIDYKMYFNSTIIKGGKNKGKPLYEANAETLHQLGMPKPFDPNGVGILEGVTATLVMEEDTYQEKKRVVPRWLNPRRAQPIEAAKVSSMWASITGQKLPAASAPAKPKTAAQIDDEVPFT
jgi:hypothetical protein